MSEKYITARITSYQWFRFSIYPWDPTAPSIPYDIPFPSLFIEPVPANDYNPLAIP